jgi:hypothetical protein
MIPPRALVLVFALCACSAEQAYHAGQTWQQNQCGGIADKAEYDRCTSRAGGTYDSYKRETER